MGFEAVSGLVSGITAAAVMLGDNWWRWFAESFFPRVWHETGALLTAPGAYPAMLWITIPLIFTLLVMTFYFGMYRHEELGWNSAVANSIVLLFVGIDLLRVIYTYSVPGSIANYSTYAIKTVVVGVILFESVLMIIFTFFHILPKRLAYFIASPLPVNLQAYVVAAIVYTRRDPTWTMFWSAAMLFIVLLALMRFLQWGECKLLERIHRQRMPEKLIQEVAVLKENVAQSQEHADDAFFDAAVPKRQRGKMPKRRTPKKRKRASS